jgi:hypothetical protein
MTRARSVAGSRFFLALDGVESGFLKSVAGGAITADVVAERGRGFYDEKRLGGLRYEPLTLRLDLSLAHAFYDWIAETWTGKAQRHDASIVAVSPQLKAISERKFSRALLTETTIPAADAASKEPAFLAAKLVPEEVRTAKGSGATVKAPASKPKAFVPSNFKLEIDKLDCSRVSRIDSFTVKQTAAAQAPGEVRLSRREPSRVEFPNLRISLAESSGQTWNAWFDDFVVKGNNDSSNERNGALSFLTPDRKSTLVAIKLFNLGIFRLAAEPQAAGAEQIARLQADLYCERMELKVG